MVGTMRFSPPGPPPAGSRSGSSLGFAAVSLRPPISTRDNCCRERLWWMKWAWVRDITQTFPSRSRAIYGPLPSHYRAITALAEGRLRGEPRKPGIRRRHGGLVSDSPGRAGRQGVYRFSVAARALPVGLEKGRPRLLGMCSAGPDQPPLLHPGRIGAGPLRFV
jgi:hypothetical protein